MRTLVFISLLTWWRRESRATSFEGDPRQERKVREEARRSLPGYFSRLNM